MGFDELLLDEPGEQPVVRFYTWRPAALSLGYFQRIADVPAARSAPAIVRRATGGGAIHHANELTFALAADARDPLYAGPVAGSYERVHGALARAFAAYGVRAERRGSAALLSDRPGTGMCFHHSTPADLIWNGRKGVGSAQRRRRGRVLHHGSIKLGPSELEPGTAGLWEARPGLAALELAGAVAAELARSLGIALEPDAATPAELEGALRRGQRYASETFVHLR